jgi:GNAT superfamily N-acetyltransferase
VTKGNGPSPSNVAGTFVAGRYPAGLEETFTVISGAILHLRAIRAEDDAKLMSFHEHLSFDSVYRRYFSIHPHLSADEVRHLTNVDYVNRVALVIEDGDQLVAVGRYDRCPDSTDAEVAFVVRDDYQHLGLGHRLLDGLVRAARARGITTFTAVTLFTNRDMMAIFRHSGYPLTTSVSHGEISVRFSIDESRGVITTPPSTSTESTF